MLPHTWKSKGMKSSEHGSQLSKPPWLLYLPGYSSFRYRTEMGVLLHAPQCLDDEIWSAGKCHIKLHIYCDVLPGIHTGYHPFLMGVHLGHYFFLNGICPGLVGVQPGDESTSKDLKLLAIGVSPGLHLFLVVGSLPPSFLWRLPDVPPFVPSP
jgi:hypothetical protein